jgi:hypothetical protein
MSLAIGPIPATAHRLTVPLGTAAVPASAHSPIMRNTRKRRLKAKLRRLKVRSEKARPRSKER